LEFNVYFTNSVGRKKMELAQEKTAAVAGFKMVCDGCGSLQIKLTDPTKLDFETIVRCGRCNAVRGTLDQLHTLARAGRGPLEI
jgi:hypothetical protein